MKCFYHADAEAVGLCKHCSRGICKACAAERGGGLACAGKHEEMVDSISQLITRNVSFTTRGSGFNLLAVGVYWGAVVVLIYLLLRETNEAMRFLFGIMGSVLLVAAIANTRLLLMRLKG